MGCTLYCPGDAREAYGQHWKLDDLVEKLMQDKLFYDYSHGGVTLSGGECLAQPEFVIALTKALYDRGVRVDIDTCGYVKQETIRQIAPYTDTFLYDIKAIDPQVHKHCTGRENGRILENLRYLCAIGARVEVRYPYVPGWNDGECGKIGAFLQDLPITKVKVLGYHNFADGKYDALELPNTLPEVKVVAADVEAPVAILRSYGLHAVNGMVED
jgi:pyruvate formate lyase activating enzyme